MRADHREPGRPAGTLSPLFIGEGVRVVRIDEPLAETVRTGRIPASGSGDSVSED